MNNSKEFILRVAIIIGLLFGVAMFVTFAITTIWGFVNLSNGVEPFLLEDSEIGLICTSGFLAIFLSIPTVRTVLKEELFRW